jgi:peptidoglycan/xylan/chitin deacetylase (PgdA/CDA1 family)
MKQRFILVGFDVEEFDMPLEYNQAISEAEQMDTGFRGLQALLPIIDATGIPCTFYTTAHFANWHPENIRQLAGQHEIASHTFYHTHFETAHLQESRLQLEAITGLPVYGLRMPRMRDVAMSDVRKAGYSYDSSMNPTWIPGRYNHLNKPRTLYYDQDILRVPASVSPHLRIPLFWLAFKNMPYAIFKKLAIQTLQHDGYLCLYFHPWEFIDISQYKIPDYTKRWSGEQLQHRLYRLIKDLAKEGDFTTTRQMILMKKPVIYGEATN